MYFAVLFYGCRLRTGSYNCTIYDDHVYIEILSIIFNDNNEEDVTAIKRKFFVVVDFAGTTDCTVIACCHKIDHCTQVGPMHHVL